MRKQPLFIYAFICSLLLLLLTKTAAQAQVEPDTTQRQKQELPTGPPMPTEQQRPQQRPEINQRPTPQQQPSQSFPPSEEQQEAEAPLRHIDRMYFGGSFGLQFGTYTNISLLPIIGYKVTEKFSVGTGAVYHYIGFRGSSYSSYGARAFTQLEFFGIGEGSVLGHAEVEFLNTKYEDNYGYIGDDRNLLTLPLVGVGYRQRIGNKASLDMLLLYNVNTNVVGNPYSNPVFRVGFNIPFTSR